MPDRCPSRKQRHPSRGLAEAHLRSLVRNREGYDGRVYPCEECCGWHVGRAKKSARRSKYA
jgi:hypothetical protein